jgi:hypothetical protein
MIVTESPRRAYAGMQIELDRGTDRVAPAGPLRGSGNLTGPASKQQAV